MPTIDSITIAGIDYREHIDITSLRLEEGLQANSDSMSFDIVLDYTDYVGGTVPKPLSGQKVSMSLSNGENFSGVLSAISQEPHTSLEKYKFHCECNESTRLFDKILVNEKGLLAKKKNEILGTGYAGDIVSRLVSKYAPGFGLGQIDKGYTIPDQEIEYQTLSSVLDNISQGIGFIWYIDNYNVIFTSDTNVSAPVTSFDIDNSTTMGGVSITEDTSRLVNRLYIKDYTAKSSDRRTDSFIADENQTFFGLFSEPWSADDVNVKVTPPTGSPQIYDVFLDPLSSREGDLKAAPGTCYVCVLNVGVRFGEGDPGLEPGSNVDVNYAPVAGDSVIVEEDPDSIRMMRSREAGDVGPTDGVYERVISTPEFRVESVGTVSAYGLLALDRLAWPIINGSLQTLSVEGWKPGQSFYITSTKRDLYDHKVFWKTGKKVNPKMYVQNVSRTYANIQGDEVIEITTVSFSNLINELVV